MRVGRARDRVLEDAGPRGEEPGDEIAGVARGRDDDAEAIELFELGEIRAQARDVRFGVEDREVIPAQERGRRLLPQALDQRLGRPDGGGVEGGEIHDQPSRPAVPRGARRSSRGT